MGRRSNSRSMSSKIDSENWMSQLPDTVIKMPLIHISIPGSHNSFSYSISSQDGVSPDSPELIQSFDRWCGAIAKRSILKWSRGQKLDVTYQLKLGIRYFDIRVVMRSLDMVVAHGMYGGLIQGFLEQINTFLEAHKKEVVILDFQHFYDFSPYHHRRLLAMLTQIFGPKICQRRRRMRENTLSSLWKDNSQVLIVYRNQAQYVHDIVWPAATFVTPWPNKIKLGELILALEEGLSNRKDDVGLVTQCVLTPTPKYVSRHIFSSLKSLAARSNRKIISWIETKMNGSQGINVVIVDFVENYNFCERVILLNYKETYNDLRPASKP